MKRPSNAQSPMPSKTEELGQLLLIKVVNSHEVSVKDDLICNNSYHVKQCVTVLLFRQWKAGLHSDKLLKGTNNECKLR